MAASLSVEPLRDTFRAALEAVLPPMQPESKGLEPLAETGSMGAETKKVDAENALKKFVEEGALLAKALETTKERLLHSPVLQLEQKVAKLEAEDVLLTKTLTEQAALLRRWLATLDQTHRANLKIVHDVGKADTSVMLEPPPPPPEGYEGYDEDGQADDAGDDEDGDGDEDNNEDDGDDDQMQT